MGGGWWVQNVMEQNGFAGVVAWAVAVIASIVLHELAHGWTAIKLGDRTPVELGHMTWNPLVHMGGMSLLIFALIGIAWGAMPVNPNRIRGRHGEALVLAAGPGINVALGVVMAILAGIWTPVATHLGVQDPFNENMAFFLEIAAILNFTLAIFNMIPIPPFDGGRIAMHYFPGYRRFSEGENGRWVVFGGFMLAFFFFGKYLMLPGAIGGYALIGLVSVAIEAGIGIGGP